MNSYTIVEYKSLPVTKLKEHPAAKIPIDEEDTASIVQSVKKNGVLVPLLVSAEPDNGQHWIYEGCNRVDAAIAACRPEVPCLLVETDAPRAVALECLSAGRKRTSGQRILAYIESNKKAVLKAREHGKKVSEGGKSPKNPTNVAVPNETAKPDFSCAGIAKHLRCSKEDVIAAIALLECIERRKTIPDQFDIESDADDKYVEELKEEHLLVLSGHAPIRTWKRGFQGRHAAKGQPRKPVNYKKRGVAALGSLNFIFSNWNKIPKSEQTEIVKTWREVMESKPEGLA